MKNICLVNGSLRGEKAASLVFLKRLRAMLASPDAETQIIRVRANAREPYPQETLQTLARADAIILVFPLFTYGIPGAMMRLLEDYARFAQNHPEPSAAAVYTVVNCGFPRPEIMAELIRVMKLFCRKLSLRWRFAVCMGGGPLAAETVKIPVLNAKYQQAFSAIVADLKHGSSGPVRDFFIHPLMPEPVIFWIKARYEKKMKAAAANS
ncbi:MAG TPA: NAD(P)H-dependent oxidoreductase [Anaerolineaceae bacterium]